MSLPADSAPPARAQTIAPRARAQTPAAPAQLFFEDFQASGNTPVGLASYVSSVATGSRHYSADTPYLSSSSVNNCNGIILNSTFTGTLTGCAGGTAGRDSLRPMAYALGLLQGQPNTMAGAGSNNAVTAYTDTGGNSAVNPCGPNPPGLAAQPNSPPFMCTTQAQSGFTFPPLGPRMFFTSSPARPITLSTASNLHYIEASTQIAVLNVNAEGNTAGCGFASPVLQFALVDNLGTTPIGGTLVDPCASTFGSNFTVPNPGGTPATMLVRAGTLSTMAAIPVSIPAAGSTLGLQLTNNQGTGLGNDSAYDNIQVLDATPQLTKSFSPASQVAGLPTTLTFTITNTSDLLAKPNWSFTDPLPGSVVVANPANPVNNCGGTITGAPGSSSITVTGSLAAQQASCTVSINVTSPVAGTFTNEVSVPTGGVLPPPTGTPVTFVPPAPAITVTKTPSPATATTAGTLVTYTYTVSNTGNVDLGSIALADTQAPPASGLPSPPSCLSTSLPVGQSTTCTASYVITQADVDNGAVHDTVVATGSPPAILNLPPVSATASATVTIPPAPGLSMSKTATPTTVGKAGDTVTYSFAVTNTGNVTIHGITINETAFSGTGTLSPPACTDTSLAPGRSTTCTVTYTVTQADINAGTITNTAVGAGKAPDGTTVLSPPSNATVTATPAPALSLTKTASPSTVTSIGEPVTYSFAVTNTGNVTVHGIAITETAFTGTGTLSPITCPATPLDPGNTATCTATYAVTAADFAAGKVDNAAHATGKEPNGATVTSNTATATVTASQAPALSLTKTVTPSTVTTAGQTVTYTFTVTNTGNLTVNSITVHDFDFSGTGALSGIDCTSVTLAPGQSASCTAAYPVTQEDVNAGKVTNSASVSGTASNGDTAVSNTATATVTATQTPALSLTKGATPGTVVSAGQTVTYNFDVTNTGNVTVEGITIDETAFTGTGTPSAITCRAPTTLAPGESTTCTASYDVTQADIDAGTVTNEAEATGTAPNETAVTSNPATATVTATQMPALTLKKTVTPGTVTTAGEPVSYGFEVTNSGNVTIHGISIADIAFSGTGTLSPITCDTTTLAPGESTLCTASYHVTQADIDAGTITNTAHATGTEPDGTTIASPDSTAEVTAAQTPALTMAKSVSPAQVTTPGDTVTYTFDVTNSGNVTVHGITIDETHFSGTGTLSAITCDTTTLAPGDHATCTATYAVTEADIDAGTVTNTARAVGLAGTAPNETTVASPESSAEVSVTQAPALSLSKTVTPGTVTAAGDTVTYTFDVTNSGNVTVHGITIDETHFSGTGTLSAITCDTTTLAPGDHATCTATYAVTEADIDAGTVTNTAVAAGTAPNGADVVSPESSAAVTADQDPHLSLTKTGSPATVTAAGDPVTYHFDVTNTGNVTITDIALTDTVFSGSGPLSPITCDPTVLAPGDHTICTATYTVTQADIDAGMITNTAHATGTAPDGATVTSPDSTATVTATQKPALSLAKSVTPGAVTGAGETVTYSFKVTNTGNVTIDTLTIHETAFSGTGTLSAITCPDTPLAPGDTATCTAVYDVTQADIDAGHIANTAHATGKEPDGATVTSPDSTATVTATPEPGLSLTKTASPGTVSTAGETVIYTFDVTNTGNVTVHGITIDETAFSGTGTPPAITCLATTLAPGDSTECVATYAVTQADINTGEVTNTAHATGKEPDGTAVTSPDSSATVTATHKPALAIAKTVTPGAVTSAGETVTYHFDVTNAGNVTVHGIVIDETAFSGTGTPSAITCAATTLAPGDHTTCTASYAVTQADINTGEVTNTAHATGKEPDGTAVTSPDSSATVTATQKPALSLAKSATPGTVTSAGETVTYHFDVTNTGNVTVQAITIREVAFSGTGTLSDIACPDTPLDPGDTVTCTATYNVTLDDINAGHITNTAEASGTGPNNATATSEPDTATVTADQDPHLSLTKSVTPGAVAMAGDAVRYSFEVTNTGNDTVHGITIVEVAFSGTGSLSDLTCPDTTLDPGESTICTATYTVSQADINAGHVTNTAHAAGTAPDGTAVTSPDDTATVTAAQAPELELAKSAQGPAEFLAGQTVTYVFAVKNTGNVTVHAIAIADFSSTGTGTLSPITCEAGTLEPGESTECTATYTLTQADINAGEITDSAHATGKEPDGTTVTSPDSEATVTGDQAPALQLSKTVTPDTVTASGETVTYTFHATNAGNITIHGIHIDEAAFTGTGTLSPVTCDTTTLAPGESATCTATYTITLADFDSGAVDNTAVAVGTAANGVTVTSDPAMATVTTTRTPALELTKTVTPDAVAVAGQTVTYTFHVTNTGNVTLHDIDITETAFSGTGTLSPITCTATTLAPGDSTDCTATYAVTQADINTGEVTNTAHATGTAPDGSSVSSEPDTATLTAIQSPALDLRKMATPDTVTSAGESVTYTFTVTNTGNVTVGGIDVDETAFSGTGTVSAITCDTTTLAPGDHTTCTASYAVTEADFDAGQVTNTARADGTTPGGVRVVSEPDTATVTAAQEPSLTMTKTASPGTVTTAGETVTYTFDVTNTGNVTITGIKIDETAFSGTAANLSAITCTDTVLAAGQSTTCAATYTVTQADINAGTITNTAHAAGTAPNGNTVTSPEHTATVTATQKAALALTKTPAPDTVTGAGQTVTFTFTVTNTGNVTITGIDIDETSFTGTGTLSPITCAATSLAPGDHTTCTATYDVTAADIDAGTITNTAIADGQAPDGDTVTSPEATATVTVTQEPALTMTKSASPATVSTAGETVTYTFTVTNAGNDTVHDIAIDETAFSGSAANLSPITCAATTLAPGDHTTCTAAYTVTAADIDAGTITNTAHATGTAPDGVTVTSPEATATVTATQEPALTLTKTASPATVSGAGDTVTYTFDVTNTGNDTIHDVAIQETAFTGTGTVSPITCHATTLAPGDHTTCTATYDVTAADIDAGTITNSAQATGTAPNGDTVTSPEATATVTATQAPALAITKTVTPGTVTTAGATVTYSIKVTNTGNDTVVGVTIHEDAFTGTGALSDFLCEPTTLAPGESTTCTATYTVTQDDIDAGTITNTAHATGSAPNGDTVTSPETTATVTTTREPSLSLNKTASPATVTSAGDTVTYSFEVTNTGNDTISDITIHEDAFTGTGTLSDFICEATPLAPGQSTICTATYTVTQDDIDAGEIFNTAHATGTAPNGETVISPESTATVTTTRESALSLVKSAMEPSVFRAGETVTYSFEVTNTGNDTITDITIHETAFTGTGTLSDIICPATTLAPGQSTTCTATYTITEEDIDAGEITNTAHATGTGPDGAEVTSPPSTVTVPQVQAPALSLSKTATPASVTRAGDTVSYSFHVTNTGNVTIDGITIQETAFSGTGTLSAITCGATTLASGQSTTCTATYAVTQADIDAGAVTNTARAAGTVPGGAPVVSLPAAAMVTVTATRDPGLSLGKTVTPATMTKAGDTVTYSFHVTNTGNDTISGITIREIAFSGTGTLSAITCPAPALAPDQSATCTATYTVTQADIDAGQVTNTADAAGTAPDGAAVSSGPATATVTAAQAPTLKPTLKLVKSAVGPSPARPGQTIIYKFEVTNAGNDTVHGITFNESEFSGTGILSPVICRSTTLSPGEVATCAAVYTVTQADANAGKVINTARAVGTASSGATVTSPPATVTVKVTGRKPSITTGVPGNGSGPSPVRIGLGAGLILLACGGMIGLVIRRRRRAGWQ